MKLLLCLALAIAIFRVQCDDVPASQEAIKDETQLTENRETDIGEDTEISNSNFEDFYDSSEYWDSLEDADVEEMDGDDVVKPTVLPETNSADVDEDENQFLDEDDDDDDIAWLMNSDAQLDDGEEAVKIEDLDNTVEDKNNSGNTWSYSQYLEQKVKERAFRKYMFIAAGVSCMTLIVSLLLIAMRLRKKSTSKKAMPYDHLHEEA